MIVVAATVTGLAGCVGEREPSNADIQKRIARERADAARQARQEERVNELQREVQRLKKRKATGTTTVGPAVPGSDSTPQPSSPDASGSWPSGTSAWTVVLVSAKAQSEAEATAARARGNGLSEVGTLLSSEHSSLRAGYWVAYSGVLSRSGAVTRQAQARASGFPGAYARYVSSP